MTPAAFSHSWPLFNYLGNLSSKWLNRGNTALFGDTHLHSPTEFKNYHFFLVDFFLQSSVNIYES